MSGLEGQIYGSETTAGGHENSVASNQLDGLQWGKSGLEMDEERKQQVLFSFSRTHFRRFHIDDDAEQ